ncbi:MAG: pseudouridine synthase, partial [bacterium]|nr:pseudouridine synthase [bacterium]
MEHKERLQKVIANAGIASRREAEKLIQQGLVTVNGRVIEELGTKVDAEQDHIKVRGKLINPRVKKIYFALHKPTGYVTTMSDPEGRPTVVSLLRGIRQRVAPVGRLDYNTEGLLLLTNDGELIHRITHPSGHIAKVYHVKVKGKPAPDKLNKLRKGVRMADGLTAPAEIRVLKSFQANTALEIVLYEGKKRQIRRMFDHVGHSVLKLKRIGIGPLRLGDLGVGKFRQLDPWE